MFNTIMPNRIINCIGVNNKHFKYTIINTSETSIDNLKTIN